MDIERQLATVVIARNIGGGQNPAAGAAAKQTAETARSEGASVAGDPGVAIAADDAGAAEDTVEPGASWRPTLAARVRSIVGLNVASFPHVDVAGPALNDRSAEASAEPGASSGNNGGGGAASSDGTQNLDPQAGATGRGALRFTPDPTSADDGGPAGHGDVSGQNPGSPGAPAERAGGVRIVADAAGPDGDASAPSPTIAPSADSLGPPEAGREPSSDHSRLTRVPAAARAVVSAPTGLGTPPADPVSSSEGSSGDAGATNGRPSPVSPAPGTTAGAQVDAGPKGDRMEPTPPPAVVSGAGQPSPAASDGFAMAAASGEPDTARAQPATEDLPLRDGNRPESRHEPTIAASVPSAPDRAAAFEDRTAATAADRRAEDAEPRPRPLAGDEALRSDEAAPRDVARLGDTLPEPRLVSDAAPLLQAERGGIIASFILNAAMTPGWPPAPPLKGLQPKAGPASSAQPQPGLAGTTGEREVQQNGLRQFLQARLERLLARTHAAIKKLGLMRRRARAGVKRLAGKLRRWLRFPRRPRS